MIRYFAIATAIVLTVAVIATAWVDRELIRIRIASVYVPVPPKAGEPSAGAAAVAAPFRGDAPWALSALPECLRQIQEASGTLAYVRSHLPAGAVPLAVPATLRYGDCVIRARAGDADVVRGEDRFHLPGPVRFYRAGTDLVLLHGEGARAELNIYRRSVPQP